MDHEFFDTIYDNEHLFDVEIWELLSREKKSMAHITPALVSARKCDTQFTLFADPRKDPDFHSDSDIPEDDDDGGGDSDDGSENTNRDDPEDDNPFVLLCSVYRSSGQSSIMC